MSLFQPRKDVLITELPVAQLNLFGVYHFPADRCCLLTISPEKLQEQFPGITENQMYPESLFSATRVAIYYKLPQFAMPVQPAFVFSNLLRMESLHLNYCSIGTLFFIVKAIQDGGGGVLNNLMVTVASFIPSGNTNQQIATLIAVLQMVVDMRINFEFCVQVCYSKISNGFQVVREFAKGCKMVLKKVGEVFPFNVFGAERFEERKLAFSSRQHDARRLFYIETDEYRYERGDQKHHGMYFSSGERTMKKPDGIYFKPFDNLNFVEKKTFEASIPNFDKRTRPNYIGKRGFYLDEPFVIFAEFGGHYVPRDEESDEESDDEAVDEAVDEESSDSSNDESNDEAVVSWRRVNNDAQPVWEAEVKKFLRLHVFIDGFGSPVVKREALARLWQRTKTLDQMYAIMGNRMLAGMMYEMLF